MQPFRSATPILYVEDDPDVWVITMTWLTRFRQPLIALSDGRQAYDFVERLGGQIELAILDIDLPGMDGVRLARAIEQVAPGVPVLFVSGGTDVNPQGHGESWTAIQKPYERSAFEATVRALLENVDRQESGGGERS